ncbi:MAG: hypothetical protein ACJ70R_00225 [Nitrososphaera sp.]
MPKIPLPIAKATSTTTTALKVFFINQREIAKDLKTASQGSHISFDADFALLWIMSLRD